MTEWKERLRALDDLGPDDEVYRRAQEGPRRSELPDGPSGPKRLAAAAVALAVFAAAAVFGWQAFRPGDREPFGPSDTSVTITLASTEDGPSATLSYDGVEQSGVFEEYVWCTATDECSAGSGESPYPPIDEGLAIPAGTPIRFEGDGRVERFVVRTPEGDRASPNAVVDTDGTDASVPEEPGDYLLWIAADWDQGSGAFYLRVRATPTPSDGPEHLQAQVADQIEVGPFPQAIAVGEGGVWVDVPANAPGAAPEIVRIDPESDRVVVRIPVPEGASDIAAGEGSVWVAQATRTDGGRRLVLQTIRIDPATNQIVSTIPDVGGTVAVGDGFVWTLAAGSDDTTTVLVKIDPGTGSVVSRQPLGATVTDIVIGGGSVWLPTLPDQGSGTLIQVDAATSQILRSLQLTSPYAPVFADGELWVPTCCDDNVVSLVRVDPSTGDTVAVPVEVGDGWPFADAYGHILLMSERGALSALSPTRHTIETVVTSDWPAAHGTVVFDPVTGSVWVSNFRRTVTRIDLMAAPGPIPTAAEIVAGDWPLGSDLAQMLGLRREESFEGGCSYFVEVNDSGTGYCLEPLEELIPARDREVDLIVIGEALRGDRITAEQLERLRETLTPA